MFTLIVLIKHCKKYCFYVRTPWYSDVCVWNIGGGKVMTEGRGKGEEEKRRKYSLMHI